MKEIDVNMLEKEKDFSDKEKKRAKTYLNVCNFFIRGINEVKKI